MAKIAGFEKAPGSGRERVHDDVECGWRIVDDQGVRVVQLDTYGSSERKLLGKVSQSIQLDRAAAQRLMSILREAFPDLR